MRRFVGERALGIAVLVFAAAVAFGVWHNAHRRVQSETTVLVAPPETPLPRDSGPKNNARPKVRRHGSQTNRTTESPSPRNAPSVRPQNRPLPSFRRKTHRTKPKRHRTPQRPKQPGQPSNPPPSQPKPLVDVSPGGPTTVCVRPVGGVNC